MAKEIVIAPPSIRSLFVGILFNGRQIASGTGFTVQSAKGPVLITNRHVVTGRHQETDQPVSETGAIPDELVINHNMAGRLGTWTPKPEPLLHHGKPRWIEHPVHGKKADIVALPLTQVGGTDLYPYDPKNPGPDIAAGPAEIVSVVGFPFGHTAGGSLPIWATGFVASDPDVDYRGLPVFLIDCRSRPGQSGSAVIAYRGGGSFFSSSGGMVVGGGPVYRFLGVYSGRIHDQSDIGTVWKASAVQELIDAV